MKKGKELYDDWESTGHEEMEKLCKKANNTQNRMTTLGHIQDDLALINDLVAICYEALSGTDFCNVKTKVRNVLYFQVENKIKEIIKTVEKLK